MRDADGKLRVRLATPATEGKANRELLPFLSRALGVPSSSVRLVRGHGSRYKVVEVIGLAGDEALHRLLGAGLDDG